MGIKGPSFAKIISKTAKDARHLNMLFNSGRTLFAVHDLFFSFCLTILQKAFHLAACHKKMKNIQREREKDRELHKSGFKSFMPAATNDVPRNLVRVIRPRTETHSVGMALRSLHDLP